MNLKLVQEFMAAAPAQLPLDRPVLLIFIFAITLILFINSSYFPNMWHIYLSSLFNWRNIFSWNHSQFSVLRIT